MLCATDGRSSRQQSWHAKPEEANGMCIEQTTTEGEPHSQAEF